jgi:hypothetical protein
MPASTDPLTSPPTTPSCWRYLGSPARPDEHVGVVAGQFPTGGGVWLSR